MAKYDFKLNQGADLNLPLQLEDALGGGDFLEGIFGGYANKEQRLFSRGDRYAYFRKQQIGY
ncbi:MAG TPA: hypothetical protein IAC66_07605 [Candidatus Aphodousia gallistercoris]|nr:hypothetical protein [Candidatus Aphodousia gallistercoris]